VGKRGRRPCREEPGLETDPGLKILQVEVGWRRKRLRQKEGRRAFGRALVWKNQEVNKAKENSSGSDIKRGGPILQQKKGVEKKRKVKTFASGKESCCRRKGEPKKKKKAAGGGRKKVRGGRFPPRRFVGGNLFAWGGGTTLRGRNKGGTEPPFQRGSSKEGSQGERTIGTEVWRAVFWGGGPEPKKEIFHNWGKVAGKRPPREKEPAGRGGRGEGRTHLGVLKLIWH